MILTTDYRGPTDNSGSCVLVYCGADRVKRIAWDCSLDARDNYRSAAARIACRLQGLHSGPGSIDAEISSHVTYALPAACNHATVHIITFKEQP